MTNNRNRNLQLAHVGLMQQRPRSLVGRRSISIVRYPTETVFGPMRAGEREIKVGDERVNVDSVRLRVFLTKGCTCVSCGLTGTHFRAERGSSLDERPHVNLYGAGPTGLEVMLTVDHVFPKSRGGPRSIDNLQVMCAPCNARKGARVQDGGSP